MATLSSTSTVSETVLVLEPHVFNDIHGIPVQVVSGEVTVQVLWDRFVNTRGVGRNIPCAECQTLRSMQVGTLCALKAWVIGKMYYFCCLF